MNPVTSCPRGRRRLRSRPNPSVWPSTTALPLLLLVAATRLLGAQPVQINELLAVNTTAVPEIVDFEDYPDWIELRNTTAAPVLLDGYFLSDDPSTPTKWAIPAGARIPANGFFIVWADGHDAAPGESHPRGAWPWRNFTTEHYHANFSLASEGETITLSRGLGAVTLDLITAANPVPQNPALVAEWRYFDHAEAAPAGWNGAIFDDSSWSRGRAQLGYGDGDEATVINGGSSANNRPITSYFRHAFHFNSTNRVESLNVRLLVDDGAVVYLNGSPVIRRNLPDGDISATTLASVSITGAAENAFSTYRLPGALLRPGTNLLAVEVHQQAADSSDVSFDLELTARTYTSVETVDSIALPFQVPDVSYGRDPTDPSIWRQFAEPTPAAANFGPVVRDLRETSGQVTVSLPAGFYTGPQSLTLTAAAGEMRYTLDGSLPHSASTLYAGPLPLPITATTVLRVRAFEAGRIPGPVETRTYFIGEATRTVPVISFVADPVTLFDNKIGIYYNQHEPVTASPSPLRDVYKNKEVPSSVEFFEPGGLPGFQVHAGTTIGAENSWAVAQRPLNIHLRSKFGDDTIHYDLFPGSTLADHTLITFRNGGDNWKTDLLRDALLPFIAEGRLRIDAQGYRPSIVFINGEYFGIHEIRQKYDEGWFTGRYHLLAGEYDHLGYAHVDSPVVKLETVEGSPSGWLELVDFINTHDLSVATNWARVEAEVDIDSYIDFIVVESYVINTSWRHNREFWKARREGARWQWLLPDIDRGFSTANLSGAAVLHDLIQEEPILRRAVANPGFKARLAQRFAAHLAATFQPARVHPIIDRLDLELRDEVPRHQQRWGSSGGMTVTGRANSLASVKSFVVQRAANMATELRRELNLGATQVLTLAFSDPAGGRVLIDGVPVGPGAHALFSGLPVELTAEPAPGYVFAGWDGLAGKVTQQITWSGSRTLNVEFRASNESRIAGTIDTDRTLTAAGSPWVAQGDLIIAPGALLVVEAGVELRLPAGAQLRVLGALRVEGSADRPVVFTGLGGARWGGLSLENATGKTGLNHLQVHYATRGWEPVKYPAAISALNSALEMNFLEILDGDSPVFTRGGSTVLRDSKLHTPYPGDCINVKGGYAEVSQCEFYGNNAPDTDAIDYDAVVNGIIRDNRIYGFRGSNSDAIDLGEKAVNILVEGNRI